MRPDLTFDIHMHLAGAGTDDSGCWLSPLFQSRYTFQLLRLLHGISKEMMATSIDAQWAADLSDTVAESDIHYGVALGFDGVYDAAGRFDPGRSQMVVPPRWVFEVCRRHANLLPGPSINPLRKDIRERLEECISGGAVLIKWLPITQGFDPADPRLAEFYQEVARAGIPILTHTGGERTFHTINPEYNDLRRLLPALDAGVKVILAHSGTRIIFTREPDHLPLMRAMLADYPHLWVDNSGLLNPSRFAHVHNLVADPLIQSRTLNGSDYPVPPSALYYPGRLGFRRIYQITRHRNLVDRDIRIKRAMGYRDEALTRPAEVLANLERWVDRVGAGVG
jgi:uncharacterized protein